MRNKYSSIKQAAKINQLKDILKYIFRNRKSTNGFAPNWDLNLKKPKELDNLKSTLNSVLFGKDKKDVFTFNPISPVQTVPEQRNAIQKALKFLLKDHLPETTAGGAGAAAGAGVTAALSKLLNSKSQPPAQVDENSIKSWLDSLMKK